VFKRARHWTLSLVRRIQSIYSHRISLRSISILLFSHLRLGLQRDPFSSGLQTKLRVFLISQMRTMCPAHFISFIWRPYRQ
jgi:hypothetical protein